MRSDARKPRNKKRGASLVVADARAESLLDVVDHVLTKGVVLTGDVVLGVADVDLVYLRLSAVLCASDKLFAARRPKRA